MKTRDLTENDNPIFFKCLEDWSDEIKESGDHKACWYEKMKDHGLRVKLAENDNGVVGGMIQYVPVEYSNAEGNDLYFVSCIWVHGYKQGRGDFRKQGMGKALIKAAEEDVKALGAKGLVVWGLSIPVFMRASWFRKQGYVKADKQGMRVLLWKKFAGDAVAPKWISQKKFSPEQTTGKVKVTSFINGGCPAMNIVHERAKRASAVFGDKVEFTTIQTFGKDEIRKYGYSDALFVGRKSVNMGPPPSYTKIHKIIARKVRKLKT